MLSVVCAWHKLYFAEECTPVLYEWPNQPNGTSHGICSRCSDILLSDGEISNVEENAGAKAEMPQRFTFREQSAAG